MSLQTIGLQGGYGNSVVLEDVNLQMQRGEWLTILGPNGSGKSTLLKLLSRVLTPKGGVVLLDGKSIHTEPAHLVAQRLALLPQAPPLPEGLTVKQMVSLGRHPYQSWWQWELDGEGKSKVAAALYQTNLLSLQDRPVEQLSGGQKQRAFLALALAQDTDILLLDEPTTFLDIHYQLEILDLLRSLQTSRQLTIVMVLHDINLAMRYSDRVALMHQGKLYALGSVDTVLTRENIKTVFAIDSVCMDTPIGKQIVILQGVN